MFRIEVLYIRFLYCIECILYGNGRIQGVLSEVCKSVIVEYHDTNFMYWIESYVYSLVHIDEWNGFQKQNNY